MSIPRPKFTHDEGIRVVSGIKAFLGCVSDAELSRRLGLHPSDICRIRNGEGKIGPRILLPIMEICDLKLSEIVALSKGAINVNQLFRRHAHRQDSAAAEGPRPVSNGDLNCQHGRGNEGRVSEG